MTQNLTNAQYDILLYQRMRKSHNGLAQMAIAGPYPQPCKIVALDGGLESEYVAWIAARRGAPPIMPAAYSSNPNRVFLEGWQSGYFPMMDVQGINCYFMMGWYKFAIIAPEGLNSDFMLGNLPYPQIQTNLESISAQQYFSKFLLNQTPVTPLQGDTMRGVPQEPDQLKKVLRVGGNSNG